MRYSAELCIFVVTSVLGNALGRRRRRRTRGKGELRCRRNDRGEGVIRADLGCVVHQVEGLVGLHLADPDLMLLLLLLDDVVDVALQRPDLVREVVENLRQAGNTC